MKPIESLLKKPFRQADLDFRLGPGIKQQQNGNITAIALCYLTSRAIQNRLDEAVGPENWSSSYEVLPPVNDDKFGCVICKLSIKIGDEWITKSDIGTPSNMDPAKGAFSDALKRAAVQWGIGRYLYNLPVLRVETCTVNPTTARDKNLANWNYAPPKTKGAQWQQYSQFWWKTPTLPEWAAHPDDLILINPQMIYTIREMLYYNGIAEQYFMAEFSLSSFEDIRKDNLEKLTTWIINNSNADTPYGDIILNQ